MKKHKIDKRKENMTAPEKGSLSPISYVEFWLKWLFFLYKRQLQMINEAIWIVNWKLKQVMWLLGNQDMISVFFYNDRRGKGIKV